MKPSKKLRKHTPFSYSGNGVEVQVYGYEGFLDGLSALADSLMNGGIIATDTVRASIGQAHVTVRSPIKVEVDSTGVGASFGGQFPLEVGVRMNVPLPPQQHIISPPDSRTPGGIGTYSARQDGTRG